MLSHIVYNTTYMMSFFRVTASNCCNTELYQLPILDFNSWKTFQIKKKKRYNIFAKKWHFWFPILNWKIRQRVIFWWKLIYFWKTFPQRTYNFRYLLWFATVLIRTKHVLIILNTVFNFHVRQTDIKNKSKIFPHKLLLTMVSFYEAVPV